MSGPFEQAWMLLKNVMDYGEIASQLPEPNPLDAALARARNQGPAPGANLEALPPAGPDPRVSRKYMKNPVQLGLDKYHPPPPPPMTEEDKALLAQLRGGQPPSINMPPKQPIPIAGTNMDEEPDATFQEKFF